jgi:hypothetical protein
MEKYDIVATEKRKTEVNALKREALVTFIADLEGEKYDSLNFDDLDPSVQDLPEETKESDVFDLDIKTNALKDHKENTARLVSEQDFSCLLFIKAIPVNFKRAEIIEVFQVISKT